ncbi:MAG: DUF58 domain-containing protein [Methanoregula sp.]|nr:DUF58 domain-containing protein [Methanoregula sp.]
MKRCAQGLCLVVILIISSAFILDKMAMLLAGGTLLAGLLGQYLLFDHRFKQIVTSLEVHRSLERTQVRKGTTLRIATTVSVTVPPHVIAKISEILPVHAALQDGEITVVAEPALSVQSYQINYRITPLVHGKMHFSGIALEVQNAFFSDQIDLSIDPFSGPDLIVQPVGLFDPASKRSTLETMEIEKMTAINGYGIRALREYYTGDDMRHIDWKVSAKFNKLFVREYTGLVNRPPLIIADLPWRDTPHSKEDLSRMVTAVAGMAEHTLRSYPFGTVLLISGPNILHIIREEKDLQQCMSALREWMHPVERTVHLYHLRDRADLRAKIRHLDNQDPQAGDGGISAFSLSMKKHYLSVLQHMKAPAFSGQIARTISSLEIDECYIFSTGCGDLSHIRQIVRMAKTMKIRIHLRMPDLRMYTIDPAGSGHISADTVEAFL